MPVSHIQRLVIDQQPDQLAVGHINDRLTGFRIAVATFGVGQGPQLVERIQIAARQRVRVALVEVAAKPKVPVG